MEDHFFAPYLPTSSTTLASSCVKVRVVEGDDGEGRGGDRGGDDDESDIYDDDCVTITRMPMLKFE